MHTRPNVSHWGQLQPLKNLHTDLCYFCCDYVLGEILSRDRLIEVFTEDSKRHNLYLTFEFSSLWFNFALKHACFFFFSFRDQQRAAFNLKRWLQETPCTLIDFSVNTTDILVYLNGNNAAEGENNIKYANSYPMKWTVKNWFAQDKFESLW